MEKEQKKLPTIYNIAVIAKEFEKVSKQKPVKDMILHTDYMFGNIDEATLIDFGFEFISMSNKAGFTTPMYRMGNIEAIFVDQILHMYEITK